MASRGHPINPIRAAARAAGERFFCEEQPCDFCGTNKRYVSNAGCVKCAVMRGKVRYAALDEAAKAELKARDHERYVKRITKPESPDASTDT